jgi:hypothetical protein
VRRQRLRQASRVESGRCLRTPSRAQRDSFANRDATAAIIASVAALIVSPVSASSKVLDLEHRARIGQLEEIDRGSRGGIAARRTRVHRTSAAVMPRGIA